MNNNNSEQRTTARGAGLETRNISSPRYIFFFIYVIHTIILPPPDYETRRRRLTQAHNSQCGPTTANTGPQQPTQAHDSQRRPAQAHDSQHRPTIAYGARDCRSSRGLGGSRRFVSRAPGMFSVIIHIIHATDILPLPDLEGPCRPTTASKSPRRPTGQ